MGTVKVVFCMDTEGPCDDPSNDELLSSWADVDRAMDKLFSDSFRKKHRDSAGRNFKIGWFFLTWSGFKTNPRGRDFGYHKVRDHYRERWGNLIDKFGDEECWHYPHPPKSGIGRAATHSAVNWLKGVSTKIALPNGKLNYLQLMVIRLCLLGT